MFDERDRSASSPLSTPADFTEGNETPILHSGPNSTAYGIEEVVIPVGESVTLPSVSSVVDVVAKANGHRLPATPRAGSFGEGSSMKLLPVRSMEPPESVAILAGNSRVHYEPSSKAIQVEPQIRAFQAAIAFAKASNGQGKSTTVSLALDHKGVFRKQFLADGLSNSAKRNPRLSQLKNEIQKIFSGIAAEADIPLDSIFVLHEDSARTHASYLVRSGQCATHLARWITVKPQDEGEYDEECANGGCRIGTRDVDRVTCAAVTSEYYAKALALGHAQHLEVFFEDDPWSSINVFTRGAALLGALGSSATIRFNFICRDGRIVSPKPTTLTCPNRTITRNIQAPPYVGGRKSQ